jgi:hypothetical protein
MPVKADYVVIDGRVLFEALRDRHGRPEPRVERRTLTTSSAGGSYRAALQVLLVGEHRDLDTGWRSPDAA